MGGVVMGMRRERGRRGRWFEGKGGLIGEWMGEVEMFILRVLYTLLL